MRRLIVIAVAVVGMSALASCTPASSPQPSDDTTVTVTTVQTRTSPPPPITFKPVPATTVAPLVPGAAPAKGEVEKACPYILSSQDQGPNSMADLEGDRVYRTTVITMTKPVGCRFYFWANPFEAIADIVPRTFVTATDAHNAMVLTGEAGTQAIGESDIAPGVDAVLYRTKFFGQDGANDWACVFAKGTVMVIVHTQQTDTSQDALNIAKALAPKF